MIQPQTNSKYCDTFN